MPAASVLDRWFCDVSADDVPAPGSLRVAIDPALSDDLRIQVLQIAGRGGILTLRTDAATTLGLADGDVVEGPHVASALATADLLLNGADALWYLPDDRDALLAAPAPTGIEVRILTADDMDAFAAFEAESPADDVEEAWVELDHWLVVGAFVGGRLACAASMYPWRGTRLADLGVLTAPEHRGRGLARAVVRAAATEAVARDHEPQYRCQTDNAPSMALAASVGLALLGTWDVVA